MDRFEENDLDCYEQPCMDNLRIFLYRPLNSGLLTYILKDAAEMLLNLKRTRMIQFRITLLLM